MSVKSKKQLREQAIAETATRHRPRLLSVIRSMMRDGSEAEDVLQEVYEEFIEAYDLGDAIETVGAWLVKVARNKVLDRFRRRKTQEEHRLLLSNEEERQEPENLWLRERFRDEILEALASLPAEQREVFVLHELEGMSFEEISAATGIGVNTLLSRKRYAVLALREFLKEVYDELE